MENKTNVYHDTEIYDLSLSVPSVFMLKSLDKYDHDENDADVFIMRGR